MLESQVFGIDNGAAFLIVVFGIVALYNWWTA
jgi:hypothetical protein